MVWAQSRWGKKIDLVNPTVEQVDFREIAESMANIYRWNGAAQEDISIGFHTLLVFAAADEATKPYALLHDAPETVYGDIIRPTREALVFIAVQSSGSADNGTVVRDAIAELDKRHYDVMLEAAGLQQPTDKIEAAVKLADNVAMMTERRDYLAHSELSWGKDLEAIKPLPLTHTVLSEDVVAERLYEQFKRYFPALSRKTKQNTIYKS